MKKLDWALLVIGFVGSILGSMFTMVSRGGSPFIILIFLGVLSLLAFFVRLIIKYFKGSNETKAKARKGIGIFLLCYGGLAMISVFAMINDPEPATAEGVIMSLSLFFAGGCFVAFKTDGVKACGLIFTAVGSFLIILGFVGNTSNNVRNVIFYRFFDRITHNPGNNFLIIGIIVFAVGVILLSLQYLKKRNLFQ